MKKKIPDDIRDFLTELADQLRVDNALFKVLKKYVGQNEELTILVDLNIELTEDKWARAVEKLEQSF